MGGQARQTFVIMWLRHLHDLGFRACFCVYRSRSNRMNCVIQELERALVALESDGGKP